MRTDPRRWAEIPVGMLLIFTALSTLRGATDADGRAAFVLILLAGAYMMIGRPLRSFEFWKIKARIDREPAVAKEIDAETRRERENIVEAAVIPGEEVADRLAVRGPTRDARVLRSGVCTFDRRAPFAVHHVHLLALVLRDGERDVRAAGGEDGRARGSGRLRVAGGTLF